MPGCLLLSLSGQTMSSPRSFQLSPPPSVSTTLIHRPLSMMKHDEADGPSDIIAEMLKLADDEGVELVRQLTKTVFSRGVMPEDWE